MVGEVPLEVWVADDAAERQRGLMGVEELPPGIGGMLFVFGEPRTVSFHMLDTPMELDVWWFDPAMRLIGSAAMEPCPGEPCPGYRSPGPVGWVLETPRGAIDPGPAARLVIVENG